MWRRGEERGRARGSCQRRLRRRLGRKRDQPRIERNRAENDAIKGKEREREVNPCVMRLNGRFVGGAATITVAKKERKEGGTPMGKLDSFLRSYHKSRARRKSGPRFTLPAFCTGIFFLTLRNRQRGLFAHEEELQF